ncbi:diguanylate cyclase [Comamonas testosteroni]|uniref:diguanylate cyclase n=1 Tax=Comamonas testosteroni TaxID=285 RepID=UPI001E4FB22B|nr:diguanylate cyclase [Comamonas testosteroni]
MEAPEGSFSDTSYIDGARRLYFFKTLPNLPFIIMMAKAHSDIYVVWRHRTLLIASVMGTLTLAFIGLSCDFEVQLKRKIRTEAEPAMLARTDGLTGLSNRHKLDEILDQEWRRATRHQSTLSLLFVDIDCFKAYNDNYGHQAGDNVLATVAKCIANNIRRPGDSTARYGGEEFLVVLPDTSSDGAEFIAENIHLAICKLAVEHTESAFGHITVSIDVCHMGPRTGRCRYGCGDPWCRRGALQRQDDRAQQGSLVSTTQMRGAAGPPLIGTAAIGQFRRCKQNGF